MNNQFDPKEGQEVEEVVNGAGSPEVSEETTSEEVSDEGTAE